VMLAVVQVRVQVPLLAVVLVPLAAAQVVRTSVRAPVLLAVPVVAVVGAVRSVRVPVPAIVRVVLAGARRVLTSVPAPLLADVGAVARRGRARGRVPRDALMRVPRDDPPGLGEHRTPRPARRADRGREAVRAGRALTIVRGSGLMTAPGLRRDRASGTAATGASGPTRATGRAGPTAGPRFRQRSRPTNWTRRRGRS
jgi:hypothetical protein